MMGWGFLALVVLGMSASESDGKARDKAPEVWGAMHISLSVGEKDAQVELDCAHGTIDGVMRPDKEGHFDIKGRYVPERPGPVRLGEPDRSQPARYVGQKHGDKLSLGIVLEDGQTIGPFELTRGSRGRVMKCK